MHEKVQQLHDKAYMVDIDFQKLRTEMSVQPSADNLKLVSLEVKGVFIDELVKKFELV